MDESTCTGRVIKQRIAKNNKVLRNNKGLHDAQNSATIYQSCAQPLSSNLSLQYFKSPYFLMPSVIIQSVLLFILAKLEQACLLNGAD